MAHGATTNRGLCQCRWCALSQEVAPAADEGNAVVGAEACAVSKAGARYAGGAACAAAEWAGSSCCPLQVPVRARAPTLTPPSTHPVRRAHEDERSVLCVADSSGALGGAMVGVIPRLIRGRGDMIARRGAPRARVPAARVVGACEIGRRPPNGAGVLHTPFGRHMVVACR